MEQRNTEIPVAFTPDENYMVPTCVAILSMLETKKSETQYKFFVVVSDKINRECLKYLERLAELRSDFSYQVIFINSSIFDGQKIWAPYLTTSAYYRLVLADVLKDYDKCMYHDGDILVTTDLQDMFDVDLDGCYVAGVKEILRHQETTEMIDLRQKCGFPFDEYINSGNLVFNLALIRHDRMVNEFLKAMEKGYPTEDQDVINLCCYGKISFLPLKYNIFLRWLNAKALLDIENQVYTLDEILEAMQRPTIIHFANGKLKPWRNLRVLYAGKWWEYARKLLHEEEYNQWYKDAAACTYQSDWRYLKKRLEPYQRVMIFGYSKIGRKVFDTVSRWGHQIPCLIDNDQKKQGQRYESCEVLAPAAAVVGFPEAVIVNTSQRFAREIRKQLMDMGVPAERIIDYNDKSVIYYLSLDPKYYNEELRDIFVKEFG